MEFHFLGVGFHFFTVGLHFFTVGLHFFTVGLHFFTVGLHFKKLKKTIGLHRRKCTICHVLNVLNLVFPFLNVVDRCLGVIGT